MIQELNLKTVHEVKKNMGKTTLQIGKQIKTKETRFCGKR